MDIDHQGLEVWECILCDSPVQYYDAQALKVHLAQHHPGAVKDIENFVDACVTATRPTMLSCPLCAWAEEQPNAFDTETLMDHIAEHTHSFALRSLPWPSTIESSHAIDPLTGSQIDDWRSKIPQIEVEVEIEHQQEPFEAQPRPNYFEDLVTYMGNNLNLTLNDSNPTKRHRESDDSNYFENNEYFAEEADSAVASATESDISNQDANSSMSESQSRYEAVAVLIVYWIPESQEDLSVTKEVLVLDFIPIGLLD